MNTNVEHNKKYIREQISPSQQKQFSQYFLSLPDHQQFQEWTPQRTSEVVTVFKNTQALLYPPKLSNFTPAQEPKGDNEVFLSRLQVKPSSKGSNCLNLLQQIEEKKAIRTGQSSRKAQKQQSWMNISNFSQFLTNSDPTKFNSDLFKSFDNIIAKSSSETGSTKSPTRMSMPVISAKKQEKKRKIQSMGDADSLKTSIQKDKAKNSMKDRLFKVKLSDKITCRKVEGDSQAKTVNIVHHQMIHRIFLPDYAMYCMEVISGSPETAVTCKRTYDDFVQLRNTLGNLYPYAKAPYLESGSWLSQNDIVLIQKNKINLQLFMRALLKHPLLSRVPPTIAFLALPEHKQIKTYFEGLDKVSPPKGLADICTPDGLMEVELSSEQYQLISELPRWQSIFSGYFQKYSDLLSCLAAHFDAIDHTYSELLKLSTEMQAVLRQLSERNTQIERHEDFQTFFRKQQKYYSQKKEESQRQAESLTHTLIPLIKYERLNISQFKPLIETVQKLTQKYIRRLENEPQSPCSAEQLPTIIANHKLQQDLWGQSENMRFFKVQLAYLHSSLLQETHLFSSRLIDSLSSTWQQLYFDPLPQRLSIKSCV